MPNAERDFIATDYNWKYSAAIGIRNGAGFIFPGPVRGEASVMSL